MPYLLLNNFTKTKTTVLCATTFLNCLLLGAIRRLLDTINLIQKYQFMLIWYGLDTETRLTCFVDRIDERTLVSIDRILYLWLPYRTTVIAVAFAGFIRRFVCRQQTVAEAIR